MDRIEPGRFGGWLLVPDIEQVLKEKKPFILHCMPSDLKVMQGRSPAWNRCALNASIIEV
jgi:hypothetical protein